MVVAWFVICGVAMFNLYCGGCGWGCLMRGGLLVAISDVGLMLQVYG